MTYKESVDWLFSQFPAYQKIGVLAYKPDLTNVLLLCEIFEVDFSRLKFIHVAGTNGKGTTCNYLASILQENKQKVGLFTSPHISDFRERIRVNGEMISEHQVSEFCVKVKNANLEVKPSFFEITWVLAIIHFLENSCDICVIETGLGGRLDATNIITPILSIITNISLDHTAILGNSIQEITPEKAGIIKENIPVIIGERREETENIFKNAAEEKKSKIFFTDDFEFSDWFHRDNSSNKTNEKTVRTAIQVLNTLNFSISEQNCLNGIKNVNRNTGFFGRLQIISENPTLILDAAHNIDGILNLVKYICSKEYKNLHVIYGASNDKDILPILNLFPNSTEFYFTEFENSRSGKKEDFIALESNKVKNKQVFENIFFAYNFVQNHVNKEDIILVTGSFFLLSDFFKFFPKKVL